MNINKTRIDERVPTNVDEGDNMDIMKDYRTEKGAIIVPVDGGYGNMKTANHVFATGVILSELAPTMSKDVLLYNENHYIIGENHKEFKFEKILDEDFYVLTLVAIAMELKSRNLHIADIQLATGLPLTWLKSQKEDFRKYLLQKDYVEFKYQGEDYLIHMVGVDVFPQGYSAVAERIHEFNGVNMLVDIGNGTINIMYINNRKPMESKCWTEKYGINQCSINICNAIMNKTGVVIDISIINDFLRMKKIDVSEKFLSVIQDTAKEYVRNVFMKVREHEYNSELMKLYVIGGGSKLLKEYGEYDKNRVFFDEDVRANAKGYEYLSYMKDKRKTKIVN
ncbi:ParM/StbA family protein [[Clostridium] fimetarium]|uniref:Plasmid segregation protein ParM n=1 Tax=[Clostridium] fimetarium TaxID=99656 RepID=A0A1I0Q1B5_9FIRM|nr:ParM/StbA family protein [[Clostridium] fimetarium]SEW20558.1 plasmid segregation protein ParM [[Clostridium] fimetarium]